MPNQRLGDIAVDPNDGDNAYALFENDISFTSNNGASWTSVLGSGASAFPPSAMNFSAVVDPVTPGVVYVGTEAGVMKGTMAGGTMHWEPFNEGLPGDVEVRDLFADERTNTLVIGTSTRGIYRRDLSPSAVCPPRALLVRDNVYDRGIGGAPVNVANPEHLLPDPSRPGFFKGDDTVAGRSYW